MLSYSYHLLSAVLLVCLLRVAAKEKLPEGDKEVQRQRSTQWERTLMLSTLCLSVVSR